jgi:thioredoxin-related protein
MPVTVRTLVFALALLAITASGAFGQQAPLPRGAASPQPLFTYDSVDEAWQEVKQSHRPLLLFASMSDCFYCEKMERETYSHPELSRSIRSLFVTAKMKKEADPELMKKLGVRAYPTTLVISPEGDLIARIEGFADPKKFVTAVRPALAKHAQTQGRTAARTSQRPASGTPRQ